MAKRTTHKGWIVEFSKGKVYRKSDMTPYDFTYTPDGIFFDGPGEHETPAYLRKYIATNLSDALFMEAEKR